MTASPSMISWGSVEALSQFPGEASDKATPAVWMPAIMLTASRCRYQCNAQRGQLCCNVLQGGEKSGGSNCIAVSPRRAQRSFFRLNVGCLGDEPVEIWR